MSLYKFFLNSYWCNSFVYINAKPSVQFSRSVVSDSLRPHGLQHARLSCPSPTPGAYSKHVHCVSDGWMNHATISSSVITYSSCLQTFPAWRSFPMSWFFESGGQTIELQLQHQSFQLIFRTDFLSWLVGFPCSSRDSQESSTPQFKSIHFLALSFLYSLTLTSIHVYWKNHSFD